MSHRPRKRFGQNFLQDPQIIFQIAEAINPRDNQHLVEIGPGKGALTDELVKHSGLLDIIELDRDLVAMLRKKYEGDNPFEYFRVGDYDRRSGQGLQPNQGRMHFGAGFKAFRGDIEQFIGSATVLHQDT